MARVIRLEEQLRRLRSTQEESETSLRLLNKCTEDVDMLRLWCWLDSAFQKQNVVGEESIDACAKSFLRVVQRNVKELKEHD